MNEHVDRECLRHEDDAICGWGLCIFYWYELASGSLMRAVQQKMVESLHGLDLEDVSKH